MAKYKLRFFFEWVAGDCIWCDNDQATLDRFDVGPIRFDELGLSAELQKILYDLSEEYQTSLDWEYPPDPSPWTRAHMRDFLARTEAAFDRLSEELGEDYEIRNLVDLPEPAIDDDDAGS